MEKDWKLDCKTRKLADKDLLKKHMTETMALRTENNQCNIDINIAESRKADLT